MVGFQPSQAYLNVASFHIDVEVNRQKSSCWNSHNAIQISVFHYTILKQVYMLLLIMDIEQFA
jgi:hypothetical protein